MRLRLAIIALCGLGVASCVLPSDFADELEADLEREQLAASQAQQAAAPAAVLHSDLPFIDPVPRPVLPKWTQAQVGRFSAGQLKAAELLHLIATAAGVQVVLDAPGLDRVGAFVFEGGTAEVLMQAVGEHLGLFWRASERGAIFSQHKVQVFDLAAFTDRAVANEVDPDQQEAEESPEGLEQLQQLQQQVQLLAGEGAEVSLAAEQGALTVRADVAGMAAVERYLAHWNRQTGQQVELDVKLVQVAFTDQSAIGLDWSAVRDRLDARLDISVAGGVSGATEGLVVRGEDRGSETLSVLFNAFANQGSVQVLTNPRGVALNGRTTDIALVTQTAYLARILPGSGGVTGAAGEAGLEPGVIESGFVLRILPKIRGRQILLRLDTRISTLKELSSVSSGNRIIQVPTLTESRFSHWARVQSGDTLVLGGVRELHNRKDAHSSPYRRNQRQQSEQVLLITPRIL